MRRKRKHLFLETNYVDGSSKSEKSAISRPPSGLGSWTWCHLKPLVSDYNHLESQVLSHITVKMTAEIKVHFLCRLLLFGMKNCIVQVQSSVTFVPLDQFSKTQARLKGHNVSYLEPQRFEASFKALEASFNLLKVYFFPTFGWSMVHSFCTFEI